MKSSTLPRLLSIAVVAATAVLMTSCKQEAPAPMQPGPMPVTVALPIKHKIVEWDRYLGRIEATQSVEIRARISGHLETIDFVEGATVQKGDLIASIDPKPLEADLARASAELLRSKTELAVAKAQQKQTEAKLIEVKARKRQFDSLENLAKKRLERAELAVVGNAIAAETVDVRRSEVQQATANLAASVAEISSAQAGIATAQATVEAAKASIAAAQANYDRAALDLTYCHLKAPISGRISRQNVDVGNFIDGGGKAGTLITTIVSTAQVYCYFDADERALLRYLRLDRSGERASSRNVKNPIFLALTDETGYPHQGYIDFVDNRVDMSTGTIRARAILKNESGLLVPGMFATIYVPGTAPQMTTLIPDSAIVSDQSDRFVWVIEKDGQIGRRDVKIGPISMGRRVIRSGLTGDEKVVIRGLQRIRPGAPVAPTVEKIELVTGPGQLPNDFTPVPESEWIKRSEDSDAKEDSKK
jgi:RND family efflux transporter MFP subunit